MKYFLFLLITFNSLFLFSQEKERLKVGLALSGGGAKGLAHISVLKVLEDAGIRFDYITGTSMGSIVGGLYAIGYSADTIQQITNSIIWDKVIKDDIDRKDLSIEEKNNYDKYIVSLPIKDSKIHLPKGMHEGQRISMLLSDLTKSVHNVSDFNQFQIPFACISANIETGKAEVFNSGFLADAMRASMAIPTIFTPVEINDNLYVDGGLINNFPVEELKRMGADIIIGVDVQSPFFKKSEITSPVHVLSQASKILRSEANIKARKQCDILIRPNVKKYSVLEFDEYESILEKGKSAGEEALNDIIYLFDSLNIPLAKSPINRLRNSGDSICIDTIIVKGVDVKDQKGLIRRFLKFKKGEFISYHKIQKSINQAYGSINYDKIIYQIKSIEEQTALILTVKKKNVNEIKVGIHYDPDLRTGLLLNYTANNLFNRRLRLQSDIVVSENPRATAKLIFNRSGFLSAEASINFMRFNLKYFENNDAVLSYGTSYYSGVFSLFSNIYNNLRIGGSTELVHTNFSTDISPFDIEDEGQNFLNIVGQIEFDSWDKTYYPTKGMVLKAYGRVINEFDQNTALSINGRYEPLFQVNKRISIQPKLFTGIMWQSSDPIWYYYKVGGPFQWHNSSFAPFIGYQFSQIMNGAYAIVRLDLQYEFVKNHYLIFKSNILKDDETPESLLDVYDYSAQYGYGLTYGYNSLLGPIELSASYNDQKELLFYFNLGFWF